MNSRSWITFRNEIADIKASFDPFYTSTTLSSATDVNVLHELKGELDDVGVYEQSEIDDFVKKYFDGVDAQELSPMNDGFRAGTQLPKIRR